LNNVAALQCFLQLDQHILICFLLQFHTKRKRFFQSIQDESKDVRTGKNGKVIPSAQNHQKAV